MIQVEVFAPTSLFDDEKFRSELKQLMNGDAKRSLNRLFKKTTEGWKSQPNFGSNFSEKATSFELIVSTKDKIYNLVDAGAEPHTIVPRRPRGKLRFQTGYSAATSPRTISSKPFVRSGEFIFARTVQHPGFEAREFAKTIAEEYAPKFKVKVNNVIEAAKAGKS